jgi:hypothetical protein
VAVNRTYLSKLEKGARYPALEIVAKLLWLSNWSRSSYRGSTCAAMAIGRYRLSTANADDQQGPDEDHRRSCVANRYSDQR